MKKQIFIVLILFAGILARQTTTFVHSSPGGAPASQTGAPRATTGFETTCAQSGCHGSNLNNGPNSVSITIQGDPDTLTPGQAYPITVKVENATGSFAGFQMVALSPSRTSVGTFTAATGNKVISGAGRSYITHTNRNSKIWNFTWTAPATLPDSVTFYAASMENTGSYRTYTTRKTILKNPVVTSIEKAVEAGSWVLYPNPARNQLHLKGFPVGQLPLSLEIIGKDGKTIYHNQNVSPVENHIELPSEMPAGIYFLKTQSNLGVQTQKFIKN